MSIGTVLMSYWVYEDGKKINALVEHTKINIEQIKTYKDDSIKYKNLEEEKETKEELIISILKDIDQTKYEPMIRTILITYKNQGLVNAELMVNDLIKEKMSSGKTKEQAIETLYSEKTSSL